MGTPTCEIVLDPVSNRTGHVWHIQLPEVEDSLLYAYRVAGPHKPHKGHRHDASALLLDPYASTVVSRPDYGNIPPPRLDPLPRFLGNSEGGGPEPEFPIF